MTINKLVLPFALLALFSATPAAAAANMSRYVAACNNDPALAETLQSAGDGMEAGRGRFCNCMAGELSKAISQGDADIYAKFVAGTMTDEDRMAHETFEDLHAFVMATENTCMVVEGFADGYDPAMVDENGVDLNAKAIDSSAYYEACIAVDWEDSRLKDDFDQEVLCGCMTYSLESMYFQEELDSLAVWYRGAPYEDVDAAVMSVHDQAAADCLGAL